MKFVDLNQQYSKYQNEIESGIQKVLHHGKYIMGPEVEELENKLKHFTGSNYCVTVSSGTHALEIALRALKVGYGDEVITTPFTWISTGQVIRLVGATPVFVDIEPDTYTLDPDLIESAITNRTKAIIPVSLFGQMPDLESINRIAEEHKIPVIEDAAQSFGATRNGVSSCNATTIGCTSFFPAKPFGCYGDGGALFTNDQVIADEIMAIRTHGGKKRHNHTVVGTNGRFDTIQAAILLAKFPYLENELNLRNETASRYQALLDETVKTPVVKDGNSHVFAQYTIEVNSDNRNSIMRALKEQEIPCSIYYPKCLHEQPVFSDLEYKWGDFPVSEAASRSVLSLPMHPFLEENEVETVAMALKNAVKG